MSDDICGAETSSTEGPCQHPAGSCPVLSHNSDDVDEDPQGRPSAFTDERARAAIEAAELGKSERGCERDAGVAHGTLANWKEKNPTFTGPDGEEYGFFSAFERARGDGETYYITEGRDPDGDVDPSFAKFMLSSSYGYQKSEKRQVDMDASVDVQSDVVEITEDDLTSDS